MSRLSGTGINTSKEILSSSSSSSAAGEFWLLKLPNPLFEQLELIKQNKRNTSNVSPSNISSSSSSSSSQSQQQQQQPVAELWIRCNKPTESKDMIRSMKFVLPQQQQNNPS